MCRYIYQNREKKKESFMSNDINTSRFYQFLASYKREGENIADTIDNLYGDGKDVLTKGEFRKFVEGEFENWSGEEKSDTEINDLVNKFWKTIDTNTSATKIKGTRYKNLNALDNNEEQKMEEKLELYVKFDKYVAGIEIPSVLTTKGYEWKKAVVAELTVTLEQLASSTKQEDLVAALDAKFTEVANKQTAIYCAVEYQNNLASSILKDYPDYKIADDQTLQKIIDKYVASIDTETKPEEIMAQMRQIVDAYLGTAGLGEGSEFDLSELGYTQNSGDKLNDIQKEVIMKKLLEAVKSDKEYEQYKDYYATALEKFAGTLTLADFEDENLVSKFKESKDYQNITTVAWVNETFAGEIKSDSPFYKALEGVSKNLADKIANDARYIKQYQEIISSVIDKVTGGELSKDDVQNYIIEEIKSNLEAFYPNGLSDMSLDEMATVYKTLESAAASEKDNDKSLAAFRSAAIKYCDALSSLGDDEFKEALKDVFGSDDYKATINKMYPSEIKTKMAALIAKVAEIGDVREMTITGWGELKDEYSMQAGTIRSFKLGANIQTKNGATVTDSITYKATSNSGANISFDSAGNMVITAPDNVTSDTITVSAYVRGKKIEPSKKITVKYTYNPASDIKKVTGWGGATSVDLNTIGTNNNGTLTDSSFADLYNNNGIIQLRSIRAENRNSNFSAQKENIRASLNALGENVIAALKTAGLDGTLLKKAVDQVVTQYISNGAASYSRDKGSSKYGSMCNKTVGVYQEEKPKNTIVDVTTSNTFKVTHLYSVSFKDFVDNVLAEYNNLKQGASESTTDDWDVTEHSDKARSWARKNAGWLFTAGKATGILPF